MRKLVVKCVILAMASVCYENTYAQSEDTNVKIRVEKKADGKLQIIEREINTTGMTEEEREQAIESLKDSLVGNMDGKQSIKVVIQDKREVGDRDEMVFENDDMDWNFESDNRAPQMEIHKKRRKGGSDDWEEFRWEMDRLGENMRQFGEEFPRKFERNMPRVYAWTDQVLGEMEPATIKSLDVFPNKPESDIVNVKFFAPNAGDVTISMLDTKGNVVASKTAKDFQGEFVGQLELKKAKKGTYFVIVSQGDDGVSRRVVLD